MSKTYSQASADHESDSSSYSYCPDFKNFIDVSEEKLFYLRIHSEETNDSKTQINLQQNDNLFRNEYKRMSLTRDRGIISKLTGVKKNSLFDWKILDKNKYEHANGCLKELKIGSIAKTRKTSNKPAKPSSKNHGRGNQFETLFNATLILGPDNKRFLISNINECSVFARDLLVGDFIKSIDGDLLSIDNIKELLIRIQNRKSFKIVAYEEDSTSRYKDEFESHEEIKLTKLCDVVVNKLKLFHLESETHELIFSLNLIVRNDSSVDDSDGFTTVFSYPPKENNFLHKLKGSFLTIASIMKTAFGTPLTSTVKVYNTNFFVSYTLKNDDNQFMFLGFNSNYVKQFDVRHYTANLVKFLDFIYPDYFNIAEFQQLETFCEIIKIQLQKGRSEIVNFEQLFSFSTSVPLPKEIVLKVNDSLSELEAMDYRNWNETLMNLFGKFNISGSCLFYKTSLICSHFSENEMENVELFMRNTCFKLIYQNCSVREIALWQRVFPKNNIQSFNIENDSTKNKVFLLVAAHCNLIMCVMLEENGYNIKHEIETQSSNYLIYFLEEMDDILDHLKTVGIENLARIWINSAKRPQCKSFGEKAQKEVNDSTGHLKTLKEEDEVSEHDCESQIDSQRSSSGFDMNDLSDAIYKDFTDIIPQTISFGNKNVLYHYTQLDVSEGIILTTINDLNLTGNNAIIIDIFRRSCIKLHKMLQNTIKFNQMLANQSTEISHKSTSMMPIKEKGILLSLQLDSGANIEIWIVGRLFGFKELFVCYDTSIPQSMIEIAFRIGLNCVG